MLTAKYLTILKTHEVISLNCQCSTTNLCWYKKNHEVNSLFRMFVDNVEKNHCWYSKIMKKIRCGQCWTKDLCSYKSWSKIFVENVEQWPAYPSPPRASDKLRYDSSFIWKRLPAEYHTNIFSPFNLHWMNDSSETSRIPGAWENHTNALKNIK